ncbi:uncharacterized protein Z520_06206 [Fonsecaea multimorphosa CBS 102226]|uniref:Uncharacterized protein n=1 Tax=Fonsecaea multimorphosa CBS 102226 TaxID=1442371 RepID=A0A0D2IM77_9EURO|nr:uncharacterized protein Z520_06206 [Fonsecaea multimorphosa CBS 102226]KIX98126.1 hypothetical protein Z520_06206 [Fonsecaea multimorphosa CBS 102226]OAL24201.1 hypothetical protein AYO22_05861 [Fonsecaea multimorphosa]
MAANTIVLITGANTGLGLETVKSLLQSSKTYTILLGGRSFEKATTAAKQVKEEFPKSQSTVTPVQIDIDDDQSIKKLSETLEKDYGRLDVLVNNAGSQFDLKLSTGELTMREMWNKSWEVNVTGTYILTYTLVPLLLKSSDPRLLFITSGTSTLAEHTNQAMPINRSPTDKGWPKASGGFGALGIPAYRASKTGLNMMMREWARVLKEDNVKVWCVSPGMLATGLGFGDPERLKQMGALDPSVGAGVVRDVVEGKRDKDVGCVVRKDGIQPW